MKQLFSCELRELTKIAEIMVRSIPLYFFFIFFFIYQYNIYMRRETDRETDRERETEREKDRERQRQRDRESLTDHENRRKTPRIKILA